jgi:menaquinone-9 beta-reductase
MHDAIIIGAGPGGSSAAIQMARAGLRVLLVDKAIFPRDKICGDAISGKSVEILRDLGLIDRLVAAESLGSWGVTFSGPSGDEVAIPFTKWLDQPVAPGFVCRRTVFDQILLDAAIESGAEVWQHADAERLLMQNGRVNGVRIRRSVQAERLSPASSRSGTRHHVDAHAPLVVGADGAYSMVARELGVPQLDERHYVAGLRAYYEGVTGFHSRNHIEIHFVDESIPGYFWIFPMAGGRANVGLGMLSSVVKKRGARLKSLLDTLVAHPRFRDRFAGARRVGPVRGWGLPLGSRPRRMSGEGWMLVGDAASLIDPFTGEGIGNAMLSGTRAARWAVDATAASDYSDLFLAGYEREVLDRLRGELGLSHSLQRLGNWKWLLNLVVRKASRSAEVQEAISVMFDDMGQRRKLVSPLFYLRVLAA